MFFEFLSYCLFVCFCGVFFSECTINKYVADNCSAVNETVLTWPAVQNLTCYEVLQNCSAHDSDLVGQCISALKDVAGDGAVASYHNTKSNYTSPSEEYF
jgi:hypothetical protein